MKISVPCADGTDRHCFGSIDTNLPFPMLGESMVSVLEDGHGRVTVQISPTPEWMSRFAAAHLTEYQIESVQQDGYFEYELDEEVCGACGSDQVYDDEGNNITAL